MSRFSRFFELVLKFFFVQLNDQLENILKAKNLTNSIRQKNWVNIIYFQLVCDCTITRNKLKKISTFIFNCYGKKILFGVQCNIS